MSLAEILTAVAVVISAVNAVVLVLTFRRAGQWRDSEAARELMDRLTACETDVTGLKARMENGATKADVARLTAEVAGLEQLLKSEIGGLTQLIRNSDAGVNRIEQLLMRAPS